MKPSAAGRRNQICKRGHISKVFACAAGSFRARCVLQETPQWIFAQLLKKPPSLPPGLLHLLTKSIELCLLACYAIN